MGFFNIIDCSDKNILLIQYEFLDPLEGLLE